MYFIDKRKAEEDKEKLQSKHNSVVRQENVAPIIDKEDSAGKASSAESTSTIKDISITSPEKVNAPRRTEESADFEEHETTNTEYNHDR